MGLMRQTHSAIHLPRISGFSPMDYTDQDEVKNTRRKGRQQEGQIRSEEHTSELQSLMRNSYAVFCLKKKKKLNTNIHNTHNTQKTRNTKRTPNKHTIQPN